MTGNRTARGRTTGMGRSEAPARSKKVPSKPPRGHKAEKGRTRQSRGTVPPKGKASKKDKGTGKRRRSFADETVTEFKTKRVKVHGVTHKIPVDEDGFVPTSAIAARFLDVTEGTGRSDRRSVISDHSVNAKKILPNRITPEDIAEWWHAPNTMDIRDIDTRGSSMFDLRGHMSKGAQEAHGKIAVDGPPEYRRMARDLIADSFTVAEQKALVKKGGLTIEIKELPDGTAARYYGKRDGMSYRLEVSPEHLDVSGSMLHELVHHSRMVDETRDHILIRSRSKSGKYVLLDPDDVALEEAATIMETLARQSDYVDPDDASYHGYVDSCGNRKGLKFLKEDRELVAGSAEPGSKGIRGRRARKKVIETFEDSNISRLVISQHSQKSAIQRFKEILKGKN